MSCTKTKISHNLRLPISSVISDSKGDFMTVSLLNIKTCNFALVPSFLQSPQPPMRRRTKEKNAPLVTKGTTSSRMIWMALGRQWSSWGQEYNNRSSRENYSRLANWISRGLSDKIGLLRRFQNRSSFRLILSNPLKQVFFKAYSTNEQVLKEDLLTVKSSEKTYSLRISLKLDLF